MKFLSSATAALLFGSVSVVMTASVPVVSFAQEAEEENVEPKASKKFRKAYAGATAVLEAGDPTAIQGSIAALQAVTKDQNDEYWLGTYRFFAGRKMNDDALQVQSLKDLIANPVTPAKTKISFRNELAALAFNKVKEYDTAATQFEALYAIAPSNAAMAFNAALAYNRLGDLKKSIIWADKAIDGQISKGAEVPETWDSAKRGGWYNIISPLRQDSYSDAPLNLNYLRLLRATNNMRFASLFTDYADFGARYPGEVVAVLEEGFAKGVIAKNDISFSEIYAEAKGNASDINKTLATDETDAKNNPKGFLAMIAGDNLLAAGQNSRAIAMYELALQKGNIAGRDGVDQSGKVMIDLARAKLANGDMAGAKAELAKITDPKQKNLVDLMLLYIDTQ